MKTHEVKITQRYYSAVKAGRKTFEVRKDDRGYKVGDHLRFKTSRFSMDALNTIIWEIKPGEWEITYKLSSEAFPEGIKEGCCVLAIKEIKK